MYEPSRRRIEWKNGSIATAFSAEESDRLRGPQHHVAWFDELAAYPNEREIWDMAQFGLRLGKRPPTSPELLELIGGADVAVDVAISRAVVAGGKREVVTADCGPRMSCREC